MRTRRPCALNLALENLESDCGSTKFKVPLNLNDNISVGWNCNVQQGPDRETLRMSSSAPSTVLVPTHRVPVLHPPRQKPVDRAGKIPFFTTKAFRYCSEGSGHSQQGSTIEGICKHPLLQSLNIRVA